MSLTYLIAEGELPKKAIKYHVECGYYCKESQLYFLRESTRGFKTHANIFGKSRAY